MDEQSENWYFFYYLHFLIFYLFDPVVPAENKLLYVHATIAGRVEDQHDLGDQTAVHLKNTISILPMRVSIQLQSVFFLKRISQFFSCFILLVKVHLDLIRFIN